MSTTAQRPGGHEIEARLGHRGLVEILLGRAPEAPGRVVRVEHLAPASAKDPTLRRAMLEAAVRAASIEHPNVARTLGVVEDATGISVIREHLEGGATCAEIVAGAIRAGDRVPPAVAARIVERAARGVHHAHERRGAQGEGLVHGAIAPRSVAVGADGRVVVHDHGAVGAKALRGPIAHLEADAVYGAPEQARTGRTDARSDVFSLGMVLYALLRLGTPHGGPEGTAVMGAVAASAMAAALADLSDVPGPLGPVLRRALATSPLDRFQSAVELADALARVVDALGGAGDGEVGAVAARYAGASEAAPEEATRRIGVVTMPVADDSSTDAGVELPTIQRPAPPAPKPGAAAPPPPRPAPPVAPPPAPKPAPPAIPLPVLAGPPTAEKLGAPIPIVPLGPSRDEGTPSTDGQAPSRPTPAGSLAAGDRFGRYVIEDRLGRGGTAEVYQAHDTVLERKVALKLLKSAEDARARERLVREAQAVATFQHPNSVVLFDVGEAEGTPYIAMELVRGRPLRAFVGDLSVPLPRRLRWLCAVARALGAAHRQGIVHRDVKPSNVMIREDGEVKVLDFGIARRDTSWGPGGGGSTLTRQGVIVGTLRYAAPEQLRSEPVDGRADQFAFGMTAFELLSGRPPFHEARAVDVAMRILVDPTPPLASFARDVPEPVAAAIDRALSKAPAARFGSMDELADVLEPYAEVLARTTMTAMVAVGGSGAYPAVAPGLTGVTHVTSSLPMPPAVAPPRPAKLRPHERALVAISGVSVVLLLVLVVVVLVRARAAPAVEPEGPTAAAPPASLACASAVVEGATPEQARAIGVGACARLGVEAGIEWAVPGGAAVEVRSEAAAGAVRVALRVGGHAAEATAPTAAEAVGAAAAKLAGAIERRPLGAREVALWGAADEAGARRIARTWRRHAASLPASIAVDAQRLVESDPDSPVPHALAVLAGAGTTDGGKAAREQALARLDRLPASRAHMLRGALLARPSAIDVGEAVRLMRTSYAEAPDDVDMVALYASEAVRLGLPEGFQVVDRLYAASPSRSLPALRAAALLAPDRDLPRSQRYASSCVETLPELAASSLVGAMLAAGRLAEAKDAVALGKALGLGAAVGDPLEYLAARVDVALEAGDTAAARDAAKGLLADPRPAVQREGAIAMAGVAMAEGKVDEALATLARESERLESLGSAEGVAALLAEHLRVRRWLGLAAPAPLVARLAAATAAAPGEIAPPLRAEALAEVGLAASGADAAAARASAARAIDELAAKSAADAPTRDAVKVRSVALVRAIDGDAAAASLWQKHPSAPFASLHRAAVDAGLALEAAGDGAAATRAYRLAETVGTPRAEQADRLFAAARLAPLGGGEPAEVTARKARLDRALAGGDKALERFVQAGPPSAPKAGARPAPKPAPRGPKRGGR